MPVVVRVGGQLAKLPLDANSWQRGRSRSLGQVAVRVTACRRCSQSAALLYLSAFPAFGSPTSLTHWAEIPRAIKLGLKWFGSSKTVTHVDWILGLLPRSQERLSRTDGQAIGDTQAGL